MKFSKEEKQKVVLGALLGIAVVYGYFEYGLGPLKASQKRSQAELTALEPKITEAKKQIASRDALKARIPQAETLLQQIDQLIPPGSPIAWFPTLVGQHFKSQGNDPVVTRMLSDVADPLVEGYRRFNWSVEIPKTDVFEFARTLAEFENSQPLVEAPSIIVEFQKDDPQYQRVSLNLTNSVKK
ncbi:MAG TPA: hypothetical protein VFG14_11080 [Chthoniobacteraceae bacterium]|nr:hypothetical protein [Chthoniobacteraceae bacterium]